jgi:hypothetical protein
MWSRMPTNVKPVPEEYPERQLISSRDYRAGSHKDISDSMKNHVNTILFSSQGETDHQNKKMH